MLSRVGFFLLILLCGESWGSFQCASFLEARRGDPEELHFFSPRVEIRPLTLHEYNPLLDILTHPEFKSRKEGIPASSFDRVMRDSGHKRLLELQFELQYQGSFMSSPYLGVFHQGKLIGSVRWWEIEPSLLKQMRKQRVFDLKPFFGPRKKFIMWSYSIDFSLWGKGFGTEVMKAQMKFAFENLEIDGMVGVIFESNMPSRAIVEKLGMSYLGKANPKVFQTDQLRLYAIDRAGFERLDQ